MTHVTCRLTAKNRDQLRNPTLGNRVRSTVTSFTLVRSVMRPAIPQTRPDALCFRVVRPSVRVCVSVGARAQVLSDALPSTSGFYEGTFL